MIVVHIAAAFEPPPGLSFVRNKAVQARSQKRLEGGLAGVVACEVILLEGVCEEALGQIFCVFIICLPFEANVFVCGFPITRENSVESAAAYELVIAACADDCRMIGDRKFVKRPANICVWIYLVNPENPV
ncbi:MAG TPA: hypothetical protein VFY67_11355 [Pyrinomonadaceae bacterium]|nr:hypothetical protein [Pyrinomonadaceae bacterium]